MSETGSTSQSACSVYSLENNSNFHQSGQSGSVTNITSDQCCHHHDPVRQAVNNNLDHNMSVLMTANLPSEIFARVYQNPEQRASCNCNVHKLSFVPNITTQCCIDRQNIQSYPQPAVVGHRLVCDV